MHHCKESDDGVTDEHTFKRTMIMLPVIKMMTMLMSLMMTMMAMMMTMMCKSVNEGQQSREEQVHPTPGVTNEMMMMVMMISYNRNNYYIYVHVISKLSKVFSIHMKLLKLVSQFPQQI